MNNPEIVTQIAEHIVRTFELPTESIVSITLELENLSPDELNEKIQILTEYEQRKSIRHTSFFSQVKVAEHEAAELKERAEISHLIF